MSPGDGLRCAPRPSGDRTRGDLIVLVLVRIALTPEGSNASAATLFRVEFVVCLGLASILFLRWGVDW